MNTLHHFGLLASVTILTALAGCSQTSSTNGDPIPQIDPAPVPSSDPTPPPGPSHPHPHPHPSHSPAPIPSPSATPVACDPAALKAFAGYGIFATNSALIQGMGISHGVVANTIRIDGADIGYGLGKELGRYDVIGDQIDLSFVDIDSGGLAYSTQVKFHEGANVYGVTKKTTPIDRAAMAAKIAAIQAKILALPTTPAAIDCPKDDDCTTTLTGTSPTVNRFTIGAASLKRRAKIVVNVPKHATAIVVIDLPDPHLKDLDVKAPAETVWTLSHPGKLTLDFMTLTGTILAPTSTLELDQALLMGRSLTQDFSTPTCNDTSSPCSTVDSQEMPEKVCL